MNTKYVHLSYVRQTHHIEILRLEYVSPSVQLDLMNNYYDYINVIL